jgi:hypothetical protein
MQIGDLLGRKTFKGCLFGVEVEVEGVGLPRGVDKFAVVQEGSLRAVDGEIGREFVFRKPMNFEQSLEALTNLKGALDGSKRVVFSERTSVHVHVNVTDMTLPQWFTFLFLWVLYEEAMINYCGDSRKGNLFCLSSRDAEGLMFTLERCAREGHIQYLNDDVRYSAVNTAATNKYGSVEFRSMRGTMDLDVLGTWLATLQAMRDKAIEISSPKKLIDLVLKDEEFTASLFPEDHFIRTFPDIDRVILENAFRCALIVDSCDFEKFSFTDEPNMDI